MKRTAILAGVDGNRPSDRLLGSSVIDPQSLNQTFHQREGAIVRVKMLTRTGWLAAALLGLAMLWPAPALAVVATLTDDTFLDAAAPNSVKGAGQAVRVQAQGGTKREITFLRWNLNLPAGTA